jgi:hypothetical protein
MHHVIAGPDWADAAQAHAERTRHLLLERDLAGDAVLGAEPLHQHEQPVGAAGEERIGAALLVMTANPNICIFRQVLFLNSMKN